MLSGAILITSCRKESNTEGNTGSNTGSNAGSNTDCPETVAAIAGSYKLTRVTMNGADLTANVSSCQLNGVWQFNADKTAIFTESGSGCNTTPQTGTWDVNGTIFTAEIGFQGTATVVNNCSSLTLTSTGNNTVSTLTRQ